MSVPDHTDLLIAGGGLAGGLIALALARSRPDLSVTVVDRDATFGGNHVWSFFDTDVDAAGGRLVAPLVCHSWRGYDIAFPAHRRTLGGTYNSIESERFDAVLRARLPGDRLLSGTAIATLDPHGATLADGRRIAAGGVIDARGAGAMPSLDLGWQKFVGQLLRLEGPHGLTRPTIMDARIDQADGYRFVYLLPFGPDQLFVEDTYYSTSPALDVPLLEGRIAAYAAARGWRIAAVERQEGAALPIAMGGDFDALWQDATIGKVGMAAGLFQPMTGYSLADAVRVAVLVAAQDDLSSPALARLLHDHARRAWRERGFYRLLARMLFRAASPPERYRVLQRFYRLDAQLIERFYAGRSTFSDKARVLIGRPPVPIHRALRLLKEPR